MLNEILVANKRGRPVVPTPRSDPDANKSFGGGDGGFGLLYALSGMTGRNQDLVPSKMGAASAYQLVAAVNRSVNLRADAVQSLNWQLIKGTSQANGSSKPQKNVIDDGEASAPKTVFGKAVRDAQKTSRIALIEQIVFALDLYGEVFVEPPHVNMTGSNNGSVPAVTVLFYVCEPDTPFADSVPTTRWSCNTS